MNENGGVSLSVSEEKVIGRTVTAARKVRVYQTELVRTHEGSLQGSWTHHIAWEPSDAIMELLSSLAHKLSRDGVDIVNLRWERGAS